VRTAVVLFTRDLRVHDNPALAAAARESERVLPLFVLDKRLLGASERRARVLGSALRDLDGSLRRLGSRLVVRRGDPVAETVRAARECCADWRQAKRFDPEGEYVRHWVPEIGTRSYPRPIVDHDEAARRFRARRN
jgi:deoxyribodipyrimidine photolyase